MTRKVQSEILSGTSSICQTPEYDSLFGFELLDREDVSEQVGHVLPTQLAQLDAAPLQVPLVFSHVGLHVTHELLREKNKNTCQRGDVSLAQRGDVLCTSLDKLMCDRNKNTTQCGHWFLPQEATHS